MSSERSENGYVKWQVFTFIIALILAAFGWFGNLVYNKLDSMEISLNKIDTRTAILEKLNDLQDGKKAGPQGLETKLMRLFTFR